MRKKYGSLNRRKYQLEKCSSPEYENGAFSMGPSVFGDGLQNAFCWQIAISVYPSAHYNEQMMVKTIKTPFVFKIRGR